jgi:hypothetical protein
VDEPIQRRRSLRNEKVRLRVPLAPQIETLGMSIRTS